MAPAHRTLLLAGIAATAAIAGLSPVWGSDGKRTPGASARRAADPTPLDPTPLARARTAAAGAPAHYGPSERYELGGGWLFRFDSGTRESRRLVRSHSTTGWSQISVPSAWNATDQSRASMEGAVGWYRKDFQLPSAPRESTWVVRFESVNNRVQAWLNGQPIGSHSGAYLPFELVLPAALLKPHSVNRLVLRVDSRRRPGDLPKVGLWWNYGGILRKVYLQPVDRVGFEAVQVLPELTCPSCDAAIEYRVTLRNYSSEPQTVHLTSAYGTLAVDLGTAPIAAGSARTFTARATLAKPRLWWPKAPYLYDVTLNAAIGRQNGEAQEWTSVGEYFLRSGVRSVEVSRAGTLLLNGRRLNFRGVGLVEDSIARGGALDEAAQRRLIADAVEVGASAIRAQYPLDEYLEELADEDGILLWSEIPLDKIPNRYLGAGPVRERAIGELRRNILTNSSHPSIIIWSIANELSPTPDASQGSYVAQAVSAAHALDPTRPVGLAVAAYPSVGCQARYYGPLDVIGLNDYFGWYPGPVGDLKDRNGLSSYLDAMRSCYRHKGLVVSEFGAEANRPGGVRERGTYGFQDDFLQFHLHVFATKPWLAGAIYWALQEFRVRPGWNGGNPKPTPPLHTKGLISFTGFRKPAFYDLRNIYQATTQITP